MIDLIQYTLLITAFIYMLFELNKNFNDKLLSICYRTFVILSCVIISYYSWVMAHYSYGVQFLVLLSCVFHMIYAIYKLVGSKQNETCSNTRVGVDSSS